MSSKAKQKSVRSRYFPILEGADVALSLAGLGVEFKRSDIIPLQVESGAGAEPQPRQVTLNRHYVSTLAFTTDAKGKVSFFASLFGGETEANQVGVVQEAKSFMVDKGGELEEEFGVAVRLQVKANKFTANTQVSLANIAAEAQLGLSRAEMEISVRGFSGSLGELLPAPRAVDITSYTEYLEAFQKIKAHVFSDAGQAHFSPVRLGIHQPWATPGA